jgi:hypothetical protein
MIHFSKRYEAAIAEGRIQAELSARLRRRLWQILNEFNRPSIYYPNRYSNYNVNSNAFEDVQRRLIDAYDISAADCPDIDEAFFWSQEAVRVFDILEFWYHELSSSEQLEFQREVNNAFLEEKFSWLLADGRLFRIDPGFLELEVVAPVIEQMSDERFRGALDEFVEARTDLSAGDTKGAIHNACKSFESVLKAILGCDAGNASQLLQQIAGTDLFDDLPAPVSKAMTQSVFMALPFLRNRLGGHGQGAEVVEVSPSYAELAVHLSATFNLLLVKKHLTRHPPPRADDIPF